LEGTANMPKRIKNNKVSDKDEGEFKKPMIRKGKKPQQTQKQKQKQIRTAKAKALVCKDGKPLKEQDDRVNIKEEEKKSKGNFTNDIMLKKDLVEDLF
jgi:hypothetical protein